MPVLKREPPKRKVFQTKFFSLFPVGLPMNPLKTPIPSLLLVRSTLDSKTVPNLRERKY